MLFFYSNTKQKKKYIYIYIYEKLLYELVNLLDYLHLSIPPQSIKMLGSLYTQGSIWFISHSNILISSLLS